MLSLHFSKQKNVYPLVSYNMRQNLQHDGTSTYNLMSQNKPLTMKKKMKRYMQYLCTNILNYIKN